MPFDFLGKKVVLYFAVRLMAMFPLSRVSNQPGARSAAAREVDDGISCHCIMQRCLGGDGQKTREISA